MNFTKTKIFILVLLRVTIGYHFLFEGLKKLMDSTWTSGSYLIQANWIFPDLFHWLANNTLILPIVDFLNTFGQIFIGLGLILGVFTKIASWAGAILVFLYYIVIPPFTQNLFFLDRNLLELFSLLVTSLFNTGEILGLDRIFKVRKEMKNG